MRSSSCLVCHSPDNFAKMGSLEFFNYPNQALFSRQSIVMHLEKNSMPPKNNDYGFPIGLTDDAERLALLDLAKAFSASATTPWPSRASSSPGSMPPRRKRPPPSPDPSAPEIRVREASLRSRRLALALGAALSIGGCKAWKAPWQPAVQDAAPEVAPVPVHARRERGRRPRLWGRRPAPLSAGSLDGERGVGADADEGLGPPGPLVRPPGGARPRGPRPLGRPHPAGRGGDPRAQRGRPPRGLPELP